MKIIDSHAHIGTYDPWDCPVDRLLRFMDTNGIEKAIVGHLKGNVQGAFSFSEACSAIENHKERFSLMLWVAPRANDLTAAQNAAASCTDRIACIKVHPATAGIPLGDPAYESYLALCQAYGFPFVAHTESDGYSNIDGLARMAKMHPEVSFIAVHMELRTNHQYAMEQIAAIPNLYGDTTFVSPEDVVKAVSICGADKLLFGTDAPVFGNTDTRCEGIDVLQSCLTKAESNMLFSANCERIFHGFQAK